MNKIWTYISAILFGALLGVIIGTKWLTGQDISVEIKKLKQNRISGESDISIPVDIQSASNRKKNRLEKRFERKQGRIMRRNERKSNKK